MGVLVGRKAPDFNAPAVLGDGSIVDNYNFKFLFWKVLP